MIFIAHRGNTNGPNPKLENKPSYIDKALNKYLKAEVDIRYTGGSFYLGHDNAQYKVPFSWLEKRSSYLYIHCKNLPALCKLLKHKYLTHYEYNFFWHENDDFTLTSNGQIWTFPGKRTCSDSIIVDLSKTVKKYKNIYGVCCDYI